MRYTWSFIASCGLVAGLCNCGMVKKVQECNELTEKINKVVTEVDAAEKATSAEPTAKDVRAMADIFDKVTKDVSAMEISTAELKGYAGEYTKMTDEAAKAAYKMAEALDAEDIEKANAAAEELDKVANREDGIIDNLNVFCTGSKQ